MKSPTSFAEEVERCPTCGGTKDAPVFDCLMQGIDEFHEESAQPKGEGK